MADYNRGKGGGDRRGGGFGGGRPGFGKQSFGRPGFGRRDGGGDRPQMHKAICSDCGASCEVPFRPSGEKPVFCKECFNRGGEDSRDSRGPRNNDSYGRDNRNDGFRENRRENLREAPKVDYNEQFEMLNAKMDKIIRLITPVIVVPKAKSAKTVEISEKVEAKVKSPAKAKKATKKTK